MHAELSSCDAPSHTPYQDLNFAPLNDSIFSLVSVPDIDNLVGLIITVQKGVFQSEGHRRGGSVSDVKNFFVRVKITSAPRTFWPMNTEPIARGLSHIEFFKECRDLECASFKVHRVMWGI